MNVGWTRVVVLSVACMAVGITQGLEQELDVDVAERVTLSLDGAVLLQSPEEGLWSIAMAWDEDWPGDWRHAGPESVTRSGPWTVLEGTITTAKGVWRLRDAYRQEGDLLKCMRRFEWEGRRRATATTLSVRFQTPGQGAGVLMPGILYHGNPSGAASGKVPVYGGEGGDAFFEEHRFAMPFVSFEWEAQNALHRAALHSLPSPAPYAHLPDQWWSMGLRPIEGGTELALLSGPCAANGQKSVVKAIQPGFMPLNEAYLDVPPGAIIEKTFYLQAGPAAAKGSGFRPAVRAALALHPPSLGPDVPSFAEIIDAKYRYALTRWYEADGMAGFRKYPDKPIFVMGWCGQAAAPGYALQVFADRFGRERDLSMAQRSLDSLSNAAFYEGGFHTWYDCGTKEWSRHEPLSQGQAMLSFAKAIRAAEKTGLDSSRWRAFLCKACDFHSARILAESWKPRSTDEAFYVAPLCEGFKQFGVQAHREAAEKAARSYAERSVDMSEPYWGGTLDAQCEDKEGAFAALQAFLAVYEMTGEEAYLAWATHACDVTISYTVLWDIDLPAGRLRDHGFKTRGWTVVSPQNQHVDVYGVLIAPAVYRVGQLTKREDLCQLALLMYRSCGQLIDPFGSQGEQPQHTNYAQRGRVKEILGLRGGYVEDWTVFWITAHFLNAAAQFQELGVCLELP